MKKTELHKDHRGRMRARFKKSGINVFEEHEILEMLLFFAIPRRNTNDIAHELLDKFGDIPGVLAAEESEICKVNGIGAAAAEKIRFFGEFYDHINAEIFCDVPIVCEDTAGMYAMLRMGIAPAGSATVLYINKEGILISEEQLYRGKSKMTDDLPRYIAKRAADMGASSILLTHNHKNELLIASPEDILITNFLRREAEKLGITKVWHVIVSDDGYIHI